MADASIPVDLFNPGQVFACLGFLEAADVLLGDAEGGFDWSDEAHVRFVLRAAGVENPFGVVLNFIKAATVEWLSPSTTMKERDGGTTVAWEGISDSADPKAPDLPGRLSGTLGGKDCTVGLGYWADGSSRFSTTFKKSTNGASSHVRLSNALTAIGNLDPGRSVSEPFDQSAQTESLFRLDLRGSVDPIHAGFSPDRLRKGGIDMRVATYPICEVLAILGLQHARPERARSRLFRYRVWSSLKSDPRHQGVLLPPVLARAAVSGSLPFLRMRCFAVDHNEVKKGGDRKMNHVNEEIST